MLGPTETEREREKTKPLYEQSRETIDNASVVEEKS
jgi:hypothetical protein